MNTTSPTAIDLVLIGGGHAHVHVLKMWAMRKLSQRRRRHTDDDDEADERADAVQLTLISPTYHTPYSGMLPGYLAGHYTYDEIHLDLAKLARLCGARFIPTAACGLSYHAAAAAGTAAGTASSGDSATTDAATNATGAAGGWITTTDGRPPIRYDCLSIDIGSAPTTWKPNDEFDESTGSVRGTENKRSTASANPTRPSTIRSVDIASSQPPKSVAVADSSAAKASLSKVLPVVIPVKPIANFCQQYDAVIRDYQSAMMKQMTTSSAVVGVDTKQVYTIAIVGGGAGGIELALSMDYQLQMMQSSSSSSSSLLPPPKSYQIVVLTRASHIMGTHNRRVRAIFERILSERQIRVVCDAHVQRVDDCVVDTDDQQPTQRMAAQSNKRVVYRTTHGIGTETPTPSSSSFSLEQEEDNLLSANSKAETEKCDDEVLVQACFWCVTAQAAPWLRDQTPLTVTDCGNFVRVRDTHECLHHPGIFAAGDCCHMDDHPRPKAGVFAVRAGPILYENLLRYCTGRGQSLRSYIPQRSFMGLVSTGNKYAVASRGNWLFLEGAWLWRLKDRIDRKWMAKYSTDLPDLTEMMDLVAARGTPPRKRRRLSPNPLLVQKGLDDTAGTLFAADPMRCGGCGAKVGSTVVARVLEAVHQRQVERAQRLGYVSPKRIDHDDAAITMIPSDKNGDRQMRPIRAMIQSIDYFRELVNDPFTFGKIVAIHALSDVHAMGASASTALTLAVAPFAADEAITESVLLHLLSGVSDVLQDEGIELVGGHTCEGHELACGLSVMGFTHDPDALLRKRGGQIGDRIVLTKPLGTGALFAAEMRGKAKGDHIREALEYMLKSSYQASLVARSATGIHACTDVTGFGLVGHLLEMLMANDGSGDSSLTQIGAVLNVPNMRFYQGGLAASAMGIYSSLQPQNARNRRAVRNHSQAAARYAVEYPLLFDPQTAGGLMFFVDPLNCDEFIRSLCGSGVEAFVIGELEEYTAQPPMVAGSGVCTIGSGTSATGERIRILCA